MRGALASLLIQGISSATYRWTRSRNNGGMWQRILQPMTNNRNNNMTILLWVVGVGIVAFTLARNLNARGIWSRMSQPIKNMRNNKKMWQQMVQPIANVFNKKEPLQNSVQPSFYDGKAVHDIEQPVTALTIIKNPVTISNSQKEV